MNAKIDDLMSTRLVTAHPHQSVGHIRQLMDEHGILSVPIVDAEGAPVGIVTATDFLNDLSDGTPASQLLKGDLYTVPQYADPSLAARIMRNHKIHHVLVTHESKLVGLITSYDLLKLVEDHRFVMKNAPDGGRKKGKRGREEDELAAERT